MRFLKVSFLFVALLHALTARSQQTQLFFSFQTGSPFHNFKNGDWQAPFVLSFNIGAEQYFVDRLAFSISFRKPWMLDMDGTTQYKEIDDYNGYSYLYTEVYTSYAIDLESKFFFDGVNEDGPYISSGLSFQHLNMAVTIESVNPSYSGSPSSYLPAFYPGTFSDDMNVYPFTLKIGHRTSGDVLVLDYFFGMSINLGAHGIKRLNEQYFDYAQFKTVSFPMGMTVGLKF